MENWEEALRACTLCPRKCQVNRLEGQKGYCNQTAKLKVARAALHYWEEPCLSGEKGSGAVFFSGCTMRCLFCQNHDIALGAAGKEISIGRLSEIFLELQAQGAHNINLVTPTHYSLHIIEALKQAKANGLKIPIVYNTSGYETIENLKRLEGLIDIYLPDLKYYTPKLAQNYSYAPDYFDRASQAIEEMLRQVGIPVFYEEGIMKKGVIVRHLQLPGHLGDSKKVIAYLYNQFGNQIYISLMNQYTPIRQFEAYPELNHKLSQKAYRKLVDYAVNLGIEKGFIQEGETADESFIPSFDAEGV